MSLRTFTYGPFDPVMRFRKYRRELNHGLGIGFVVNVEVADYGSTSGTRLGTYYDWHRSALLIVITLPSRRYHWGCLFTNRKKSRTMPWTIREAEIEAKKVTA